MVRKALSGKVTFQQTPEGRERVSWIFGEENFSVFRMFQTQQRVSTF